MANIFIHFYLCKQPSSYNKIDKIYPLQSNKKNSEEKWDGGILRAR